MPAPARSRRVHVAGPLPLALALPLLAAACGGGGGGGARSLDGALSDIPVFAPARKVRQASSFGSDDPSDPMKFSSYRWYFRTRKSAAAVEAFYLARWPGAGRVEVDDGIHLRNPPLPADEATPLGESVSVVIYHEPEDGQTVFGIEEEVFASRRP